MSGDHTHWRWMEPADGYRSWYYQSTAREAYASGFENDATRFVVAVSADDTTWVTLTRPQFERLASRLDGVQTVDEIALLVHGEQWSEADLFGDLIAKGGQS